MTCGFGGVEGNEAITLKTPFDAVFFVTEGALAYLARRLLILTWHDSLLTGTLYFEDAAKPGDVTELKEGDVCHITAESTVKWATPSKGRGTLHPRCLFKLFAYDLF